MAKYNYWTAGGKPSEYLKPNYLDSSLGNVVNVPTGIEYTLSCKARSPKGGVLRFSAFDTPVSEGVLETTLTSEFQEVAITWLETHAGNVYIRDKNNIGDIEVKDIRLVEKPLGKATINGLDGFLSGKWKLNGVTGAVRVIDDENLEVTVMSGGGTYPNDFNIELLPGEKYTVAVEGSINAGIVVRSVDGAITYVPPQSINGRKSFTFTANPNAATRTVYVRLYNGSSLQGTVHTFKQPIINLGDTPVPYEKKRGERMVPPVRAGKNMANPLELLLPTGDGDWMKGANVYKFYNVKPNTMYTFSALEIKPTPASNSTYTLAYKWIRADGSEYTPNAHNAGTALPITSPSDAVKIGVYVYPEDSMYSKYIRGLQLEEGPATPYEPYKVGTARKATKTPIGKNLFDIKQLDSMLWVQAGILALFKEYDLKPNTNYTLSSNVPATATANLYFNGTGTAAYGVMNGKPVTVTTGPTGKLYIAIPNSPYREYTAGILNGTYWVQLEEGSAPTAFEPVRSGLRRATKFPKKNLFRGFITESLVGGGVRTPISERELLASPDIMNRNFYWLADVKANTDYSVSFIAESATAGNGQIGIFNEDATLTLAPYSSTGQKFNTGNRTKIRVYFKNGLAIEPVTFKDVQFEEGSLTPFEPYKLISRPARKGLDFNGLSDRMQVAASLATLGNKDFVIEAVFNYSPLNPGGYSQQSIVSCGDIRFGVSNVTAKTIGFYTPASGWVAVPAPLDLDKPVKLKAVVKPSKVSIYIDDVWISDKDYTGVINATPQTVLHIGSFGGGQYFYSGALLSLELVSEGVPIFDFDFTKPQNNLGTRIKGNTGLDATVFGSPYQLNRQARR